MKANATTQQVAIVTGASSGTGLGITRALLDHGYRVAATSRTISKSQTLKPSADLVLVDGDIGKKETALNVATAAVSHFKRIDLLVKCAGIVVFDTVGGETLERSWGVLKSGGRLVTVATQSETSADQRVRDAFFVMEPNQAQLLEIARLIDAGQLQPPTVAAVFWLAQGREVYARAQQGHLGARSRCILASGLGREHHGSR